MKNSKVILLENTFYTVLSLRMEVMRYLQEKGYEIYVLSTGPLEDQEKLKESGYVVVDVGSVVMNPLKALGFFYNLMMSIRDIHPRAIISFTIRPNIFGSIAARILGIPIISNVTGTGPLTTDSGILYSVIRQLYRFAFRKNKTVFFQNQDDRDYFIAKKFVNTSQAKLLPGSGVDTSYYLPQAKESKVFSFLMISRLIRDKGVVEYIQAARMVKSQFPEIRCQLLGPFWTQSVGKNTIAKEEVDQWVEEGVIDYLGYTLDVRPYIANADVIVLPSYREGCANVLMQGASMARPLIATNVTGCRNLVEDRITGDLCQVRNAQDLADKMIAMYRRTSVEREIMGQKGREKMIREYQKSIVLEAYLNEIENI